MNHSNMLLRPGTGTSEGRAPDKWLADLRKARDDAAKGLRPQVTILDIDAGGGSNATEPTTPRSVEACLRMGIDPAELRHIPFEDFLRHERGQADLANLLYTSAEKLRQERLTLLVEERQRLVEAETKLRVGRGAAQPATNGAEFAAASSTAVDLEAKRLEVMKRRQERELEQMLSFELARKSLQDKAEEKVRHMEARAEQQRRAKQAADAEWRKQQRLREVQRAEEELAREREVKAMEAERHQQEMEAAAREAEAERERHHQAYLREQERIRKAEQARQETERILQEQQAAVDAKKAEMQQREAAKEKAKAEAAAAKEAENAEARRRAEARIKTALEANREIEAKRRRDYDIKQEQNEERRK